MLSKGFRSIIFVTSLIALVFSFNLLVGAQDRTTGNSAGQPKSNQQSGNTGQSGTDKRGNNQSGMSNQNTGNKSGQSGNATGSSSLADSERKFVMETAHNGMAEVMLGRMASERASSDEVKRFGQRMVDDHTKANQELMQLASTKGITLPAMSDMGGDMTGGAMTGTDTTMSNTQTSASGSQTTGQTSGSQSTGSQSTGSQTTGSTDRSTTGMQTSGSTTGMSGHGTGAHGAHMMDAKHQKLMDRMSSLSGADFDREYMKQMVKDHEDAVSDFQKQSTRGKDPDLRAFAARTLPALQEHLRMAREIEARVRGGSNTNTNRSNTSGDTNSTTKRP